MSSLSAKDRVSLCMFSFADGRRCRTPRLRNHPHFCYDHAEKEARARTAQSLGADLARYFSGTYLSACDLSTALGCLIPAVVRGDVKPRTARTVAYMAQTLLQSIHISQHEYCEAFSPDTWRKSIRTSINSNHSYRFPPAPQPQQPQSQQAQQPASAPPSHQPQPATQPIPAPVAREAINSSPAPPPLQPAPTQQPVPLPHTPLPATGAEFAQQVLAGLPTGSFPATPHVQPAPHNPQLAETPAANCHSERSEESAFSSSSAPSPTSACAPQTPATPPSPVCHPERSEGSHPTPASQSARPPESTAQLDNPPPTRPSTPQRAPDRDPYAVHFDSVRVDGKLL